MRRSRPRWRARPRSRACQGDAARQHGRGRDRAEAEDKWAEIDKLPLEIDALSLLSEALNFDFARKGMDEAFTDAEIAEMSGLQGIRDRVLAVKKNPTVRDFIHFSGRGRVHNPIVGGPKEVADRLEQWFVGARLRRLRGVRHPRARRLRGFRALRRAGAAAPRPVPQRVCGHELAGESRPAGAGVRGVADGTLVGGLVDCRWDWARLMPAMPLARKQAQRDFRVWAEILLKFASCGAPFTVGIGMCYRIVRSGSRGRHGVPFCRLSNSISSAPSCAGPMAAR